MQQLCTAAEHLPTQDDEHLPKQQTTVLMRLMLIPHALTLLHSTGIELGKSASKGRHELFCIDRRHHATLLLLFPVAKQSSPHAALPLHWCSPTPLVDREVEYATRPTLSWEAMLFVFYAHRRCPNAFVSRPDAQSAGRGSRYGARAR
jgi:hypothetical protein